MIEHPIDLKLTAVLFRAFEHIKVAIERDIASHGLNNTEFGTLEMLYHKGSQSIQDISKKLLMANSSMTYTIDKLESKKYVKRHKDLKDKRSTRIELTAEGKSYIEGILPKHANSLSFLYEKLSVDEKITLITYLKTIGYHAEKRNRGEIV